MKAKPSPQPSAPGAENALSTTLLPLMITSWNSSLNSSSPTAPEMGLLGSGGLVVPVVRLNVTGFDFEPMKHSLPRIALFRCNLTGSDRATPSRKSRLDRLMPGLPTNSAVTVTPVKPSLMSLLNHSCASFDHHVGALMPNRPPGTVSGVFDSVSPLAAATNVSAPVSSFRIEPPCSVIVILTGTVFASVVNSPPLLCTNTHRFTSGFLSGHCANTAKSPLGVASAGAATARASMDAAA